MPAGARWDGLYQGPYHLALSIRTQGNRAVGTWRAVGGREGELTGTVAGNLLVLDWSERGLNNADMSSGRGYFVYGVARGSGVHQLHGAWGTGPAATMTAWWAVKRGDQPLRGSAAQLIDSDASEEDSADPSLCDVGCDTVDTEAE